MGAAPGAGKPARIAWDALPAEEVLPGVTRQVVQGEKQTMVRYVYAPGAVFPVHHHPQEQVTVVVSGRIAFDVAGVEYQLGPGEVAVIPSGVPHGARVLGDTVVETFNALSPRRDDNPVLARIEGEGRNA